MKVLLVSEGAHELGGALETLVQRSAGKAMAFDRKKASDPDLRSAHGKGRGFEKKAVRCMIYAQQRGFDAVILVIDEDGDSDRRRQFSAAQQYQKVGIRRAFGIAIRTFDAWMLADEMALSKVLGRSISKQPDPEGIRDPKAICAHLCVDQTYGLTEFYAAVAREIEVGMLEERCPKGFGAFAARVRVL